MRGHSKLLATLGCLVSMVPAQVPGAETAELVGTAVCLPAGPAEGVVVALTGSAIPTPPPLQHVAEIDQRGLRFVPHVLAIPLGTTVSFPNNDPIRHNVFSPSETRMFNLGTYHPGESRSVRFDHPGIVEILCNVHPDMLAYVVVLDTPYFGVSSATGAFRITDIPAGGYSLSVWCENHGWTAWSLTVAPEQRATARVEVGGVGAIVDGQQLSPATFN
ncbi:MAG: methylamine utilization protein [Candidatus Schekmanbacteria bacterium]|nr:methylamine utilization protein [Candidatus Schekmanbacteria bacterium]